jgi:Flp pilus assembly pilin Flp
MLRHLTFAFLRFARKEEGQAITEYIMILSVCLMTAIALGRGIVKMFDQGILKLGAQLEKDLKTGRAPLNVWKN